MKKVDNEEFISDEVQKIQENVYFEAEDYKVDETSLNSFEYFKVNEVDLNQVNTSEPSKKNFLDKFNKLKHSLNSIGGTVSSAAAVVVGVGVGVITIIPEMPSHVEEIDYGKIELLNYYVDYSSNKSLRLSFDIQLEDGYYATVENKATNEVKVVDNKYLQFNDIGDEILTFELCVSNEYESVDSSTFIVNPNSKNTYLGNSEIEYEISINEDMTHNLSLIINEASSHVDAYLKDLNGNYLEYDFIYEENTISFLNVSETEFDIFIGEYYIEDDNYYLKTDYKIDNFNILKPSDIELIRLEILNDSYIDYENGLPTHLYFDGYLTGKDYAEVVVYDSNNVELGKLTNILDMNNPCTFYDLPVDEELTFSYKVYNGNKIIDEELHKTSLTISEDYLNASYTFTGSNPGECLITYNEDGTYNCYVYTDFENQSEYNMIYKMELTKGFDAVYEYIGTEKVASFEDITFDDSYSLVYKVFVQDGINCYAVKDFYAASGLVGEGLANGENNANIIYIDSQEDRIYSIYSYAYIEGDTIVEITLSSGEVLNYSFTKEEIKNEAVIDLTAYEFESIKFKVTVNSNPCYGLGDMILNMDVNVKGDITQKIVVEHSE